MTKHGVIYHILWFFILVISSGCTALRITSVSTETVSQVTFSPNPHDSDNTRQLSEQVGDILHDFTRTEDANSSKTIVVDGGQIGGEAKSHMKLQVKPTRSTASIKGSVIESTSLRGLNTEGSSILAKTREVIVIENIFDRWFLASITYKCSGDSMISFALDTFEKENNYDLKSANHGSSVETYKGILLPGIHRLIFEASVGSKTHSVSASCTAEYSVDLFSTDKKQGE